jgi:signal transduction histidine kinase
LQPLGFSVETAENFQDGLHKIQADSFDLVLLDVMLPDGRGVDLLDTIRERDPEMVTVIITGYATVELAVDTIKRGAYNFISKPFSVDMLLMTVSQGLEKRRLSLEAKRLQAIEREAAEIARARDEAEWMNEYKSNFLLMITHELRSPVSGAQSLVRTMRRGLAGELNPQQADMLSRVEIRLDSLLDLINDLLALAAGKSMPADQPLDIVPVQPVVRRVIENFADEASNKQVMINYPASGKSLSVWGTENGMDTILKNLIGNAVKYTQPGGRVEIKTLKEDDSVKITIADNGMGIPEEDLPHIWDEFFRAKNAHRSGIIGTGLGLSIVKQFVDRFGGQVSATSNLGKGTTFTVLLKAK